MRNKNRKFFIIGDIIIYFILGIFFAVLGMKILSTENIFPSRAEIYVNNKLIYTQKLQKDQKKIFIETDIGVVEVEFKNNMVRAISSKSPRKLIVKQGWAKNSGDLLIGIPDKMVIKIIGSKGDELDGIAR
ncbi:MAG: NusG domain II-containing protein [Fusobacteriaceae bacterium]